MLNYLLRTPDGQTALSFIGFGAAVTWGAAGYQIGTAARMGPGFFPFALGIILMGIGLGVLVGGMRRQQSERAGALEIRPLVFVTLAVAIGGVLLSRFGLIPAVIGATFIGALAERKANWLRVAVVSLLLVAFAWLVFIYGLNLRLPLLRI